MIETQKMFATAATANQIDAGVGVIWWTTHSAGHFALTVVDYDIFEVPSINAEWVGTLLQRSAELVDKHKPTQRECHLRIEHPGLINIFKRADDAYRDTQASARGPNRAEYDIQPIKEYESKKWPLTLDERAFSIRPLVDSGKVVKVQTGLRRFGFRAIRTNHLISQIRQHRPGDAASAGELLYAFVLGVLIGTTPRGTTCFGPFPEKGIPSTGPFGSIYVRGRRPL